MDADTVKLIQKVTLANAALKGIPQAQHAENCLVEKDDPTAMVGPKCNCGADAINSAIKEALSQLTLP